MKITIHVGMASLLALTMAGCGTPFASICDKIQECSGGNDQDVDACVVQGDVLRDVAAAYDCSKQFSTWADCYDAKGTCKGGHFAAECGDEQRALETCQEAASDLTSGGLTVQISSPACTEYKKMAIACCAKLTDLDKQVCEAQVGNIDPANTPPELCEAALQAIHC